MEITTKNYKQCDVIGINGRIDSATAPQLNAAFEKLNSEGRFKIVVDFSETDFMSSAGFRALLAGQRNCRRYNRGEVVLAQLPKNIHDALELAGFTSLFKVFDNLTDAVGSF